MSTAVAFAALTESWVLCTGRRSPQPVQPRHHGLPGDGHHGDALWRRGWYRRAISVRDDGEIEFGRTAPLPDGAFCARSSSGPGIARRIWVAEGPAGRHVHGIPASSAFRIARVITGECWPWWYLSCAGG